MSTNIRQEKLKVYEQSYVTLKKTLDSIPREAWKYKPTPDKWSIHEYCIHLTDTEAIYYIRFLRLLAENNNPTITFAQEDWAKATDYFHQDVENALKVFESLHRSSSALLKSIPEHLWSNKSEHPRLGILDLEGLLDQNIRHLTGHIATMTKRFEEWKQTKNNKR